MERDLFSELIQWKNSSKRKPLIIRGARQTGKTWLMKEFGRTQYENFVYVDFFNNQQMQNLFKINFDIDRLIEGIELYCKTKITKDTLIIFDEIQEVKEALASLKYFYETDYKIICAGSFLGIALHENTSFPVGKVEFLDLYPMTFTEFLKAIGKENIANIIISNNYDLIEAIKLEIIELLRKYLFIGGMPEVVLTYVESADYTEVRKVQNQILISYENDMSKHAPANIVPRIRLLWNSIPKQLARENKKFIYDLIKSGARAKEYEIALTWLLDCGLCHKINRISKPTIPLKFYEDMHAFKIFILDSGLLGALTNIDASIIISGDNLLSEYKGVLTEQFVCQQLITKNLHLYYWSASSSSGEIDFIIEYKNKIYPIEVKSTENLQAKSLKFFKEKYLIKKSVRTSLSSYRDDGWLINIPLYLIEYLVEFLD